MHEASEKIWESIETEQARFEAAIAVRDIDTAEQARRAAWESLPEPRFEWDCSKAVLTPLVEFLRDHGKASEALELLEDLYDSGTVRSTQPTPPILLATVRLALGQERQAHADLERVLKQFGKRAFAGHDAQLLKFAETGERPEGLFTLETEAQPQLLESELPDDVHEQITLLAEVGDKRQLSGDLDGAVKAWRKAVDLLPEPKTFWEAASWLYGSIGDVLTDQALAEKDELKATALLADAREALVEAIAAPEGATNPLTLMRRGQVEHELDNPQAAREYLLQAYMLDGETVFELEHPKYLDVLRSYGDI